jgi:hypothetical protein
MYRPVSCLTKCERMRARIVVEPPYLSKQHDVIANLAGVHLITEK